MGVRPPRIRLTIDRLALRGVEPAQRDAVLRALTGELQRLLAEDGALRALGGSRSVAQARAQPIVVGPGAGAAGIGRQLARGLNGALRS